MNLLNNETFSPEELSEIRDYLCEYVEPVELRRVFDGDKNELKTAGDIFNSAVAGKATIESVADAIEFAAGKTDLADELRARIAELEET